MPSRNRPRYAALAAFAQATFGLTLTLALAGCALTGTAPPSPVTGAALQGTIHGGQAPISGAHIYLYAANTTGYNTTGATNPSVSLLNNVPGSTTQDASGNYYVTSDANGNFSITSDYTCTPDSGSIAGQQVYLYAIGGSQGGVANAVSGLMAVLGDCPAAGTFAGSIPSLVMNEVTTVAAAYAMAGFAWDATHVSSSGTTLAKTGVKNAFANAANLVALSTGTALATTPAGNGTVPQATIYTLANILAACVNSNGAVTGPGDPSTCYTIFNNAKSAGSTGTVPSDTATAAINIAHNPGANISQLYFVPSTVPPFSSALASPPNDFTIGISLTGGGLNQTASFNEPYGIAIDGAGSVWVTNFEANSVSEFSAAGAPLSGTNGYTGGGLNEPQNIAVDKNGNVWIVNLDSVTELSSSGQVVSGAGNGAYTGAAFADPVGLAIDGTNNVWLTNTNFSSINTVVKLTNSGTLSGSPYTAGGLSSPLAVAINGSGDAWITNDKANSTTELSSAGVVLSNNGNGAYTGGGLSHPGNVAIDSTGAVWILNGGSADSLSKFYTSGTPVYSSGLNLRVSANGGIAIDGSGNVWVSNYLGANVVELSNAGVFSSGANGYQGGTMNQPAGIAVDGSGNVWVANTANESITELIGAATPVITPICAGLPSTPTAYGTSNLGTKP